MSIEAEYIDSFEDMSLPDNILRGIYSCGYMEPTEIQQLIIKPIVTHSDDFFAQAQSGTGKTVAFTSSVLAKLNPKSPTLQAIFISPTQELADQTYSVIQAIASFSNINVHLFSGNKFTFTKDLQVAVVTLGGLKRLTQTQNITFNNLKAVVFDEADTFFLDESNESKTLKLFENLPKTQNIMFSATLSDETKDKCCSFMRNPQLLLLPKRDVRVKAISEYYIKTRPEYTVEYVLDIMANVAFSQAFVFCNNPELAEKIHSTLSKNRFQTVLVHRKSKKAATSEALADFKKGKYRVLVGSDVLARGLDMQSTSLVINVDMPKHPETYIHRVGRAGRAGRKATAISLITNDAAVMMVNNLQSNYGCSFTELKSLTEINQD